MLRDRPHVVGDRELASLSRLRHHVRDVDHGAAKIREGFLYPAAEQGRNRARKEASGAEHEHVSGLYGLDNPRWCRNSGRLHEDLGDLFADLVDHGLSTRYGPVRVADNERQALHRGWKYAAFDPQEPGRLFDALAEATGHVGKRRDDDVSHAVVVEVPGCLETVIEDL